MEVDGLQCMLILAESYGLQQTQKNLHASGPVTVANNVLFGGCSDLEGALFAMDVDTRKILWTYNTGATIYGGVSMSDGCVYVGNGYKVCLGVGIPPFTTGTLLYVFCIS
ncbi:hypothetical protein FRX31_021479 [Thalictrum thalictroides]|uniref:Polyvinylalcohol dehydrogenase n=1 Tax=Thalictrum thalictroides TaxID=46969 RepID=A0A7J6VVP3_THATH|nr:hypothetical protein FRX31_021479 [Thalictrum thalictroides]